MSMESKPIGVICAMDIELEKLVDRLEDGEIVDAASYRFYRGMIGGKAVVLVKCGIGKVNAARGTQMMIDRFEPEVIINSGIAGGTAEGLHIGDVVIGTECVQHDFDVTAFNYSKGFIPQSGEDDGPSTFYSDLVTVGELTVAAETVAPDRNVMQGRIASGDQFVASAEKKKEIAEDFGAACAEMEGAAIAQTCAYGEVPFAVLRAISDLADGSAPENYTEFEKAAAVMSAEVIVEFITNHE